MRPTIAPLELEDSTVVLDLDDFTRRTADPALPEPRHLGDGVVVSPAYMQRVVEAADRERRARLGAHAPTTGDR